jgi:hypothetical protein
MTILEGLQIAACVITMIVGVAALFWPLRVQGFIGLDAVGGRGITEIRVVLGILFVGLGLLPLILGAPETFQMLGYIYLMMGVVRTISMFLDKSIVQSNVISIITEFVFGVILVL